MTKKRFWVFGYDEFYPGGGMNDFQAEFDTIEEAETYLRQQWAKYDYFDVYDCETDKILLSMNNGIITT